MGGKYTTGLQENGVDIGSIMVEKSYLMDMYPSLIDNQKAPGLWAWGNNSYGKLGDNTINKTSSPIQTIAGGSNWKQAAAAYSHTAAIKTDGTLWLWGDNASSQLGDNTTTPKSSPVQTVAGGSNWKQVSAGGYFTAAIKTDGTLWLWGYNGDGGLGQGSSNPTLLNINSPIQTICSGSNWKTVSCGTYHTSAIKTDGTLWTWGYNGNGGPLGDNTQVGKSSPIQTIAGGSNWKTVSCGTYHTSAIKTDGTLWTWGRNNTGQLGDNSTVSKSSPVQTITSGTNWKQVTIGFGHTSAIKTDGTLWTWGYNSYGQLGDNTITNNSSPIQTICSGSNWKQLTTLGYHITAIKTDGTLWSWGKNTSGQLGNGINVTHNSSPIQIVAGGTNWKSVSAGSSHTIAIKESDEF